MLVVGVLSALACPRGAGPVAHASLIGLEAPLLPGPGLRVALAAQVFEVPAELIIDVTSPLSLVTTACLDGPMVGARGASIADPIGPDAVLPVTRLSGLTVAGRRLVPMKAALVESRACVVVLGTDVLAGAALELHPSRRTLRFVASRSRDGWVDEAQRRGGEAQVLTLTRDPTHDWPLLAARLTQGAASLTGTFALSTRERSSRVYDATVRGAGFSSTRELLQQLALPKELVPLEAGAVQSVAVDQVELAPGVGASGLSFTLLAGAPPHGVVGVLAADAWGRFEATIDLGAGVLVLQRPRVLSAGDRFQCARGELAPTEDGCFELQQARGPEGLLVTATVWSPLREGGRLYLDFPGLSPVCRVGFTFDRGDRGRSTQHAVPWTRLFESMKDCAESLAPAKEVALALYEDSPLRECPGVCAFAQDLRTGRMSCECQPGPLGLPADVERQVLERLKAVVPPAAAPVLEPADPDP